jgi:hypothetical protein
LNIIYNGGDRHEISGELSGWCVGGRGCRVVACAFLGLELRTKLQTEAEAELKKAEEGWQKVATELNQKLEETRQELKTFVEQSSAEGVETGTEPAA